LICMNIAEKCLMATSLFLVLIIICVTMTYESKIEQYDEWHKELTQQYLVLQKKLKKIEQSKTYQTAIELSKYDLVDEDFIQIANITEKTPLNITAASALIDYTKKLCISPPLQLALLDKESRFDKYAVSPVNARGLGQIMPITEKWIMEKYGHLLGMKYEPERIFEPEYNLACSTLIIYDMLQRYGDDDFHKILTEYNMGIGNAKRYYEKHKTYETKYSQSILKNSKNYAALFSSRH